MQKSRKTKIKIIFGSTALSLFLMVFLFQNFSFKSFFKEMIEREREIQEVRTYELLISENAVKFYGAINNIDYVAKEVNVKISPSTRSKIDLLRTELPKLASQSRSSLLLSSRSDIANRKRYLLEKYQLLMSYKTEIETYEKRLKSNLHYLSFLISQLDGAVSSGISDLLSCKNAGNQKDSRNANAQYFCDEIPVGKTDHGYTYSRYLKDHVNGNHYLYRRMTGGDCSGTTNTTHLDVPCVDFNKVLSEKEFNDWMSSSLVYLPQFPAPAKGLCTAAEYLQKRPDVAKAVQYYAVMRRGIPSAIDHYKAAGYKEGMCNPVVVGAKTLCTPKAYLEQNRDVANHGFFGNNPEEHYRRYGKNENRCRLVMSAASRANLVDSWASKKTYFRAPISYSDAQTTRNYEFVLNGSRRYGDSFAIYNNRVIKNGLITYAQSCFRLPGVAVDPTSQSMKYTYYYTSGGALLPSSSASFDMNIKLPGISFKNINFCGLFKLDLTNLKNPKFNMIAMSAPKFDMINITPLHVSLNSGPIDILSSLINNLISVFSLYDLVTGTTDKRIYTPIERDLRSGEFFVKYFSNSLGKQLSGFLTDKQLSDKLESLGGEEVRPEPPVSHPIFKFIKIQKPIDMNTELRKFMEQYRDRLEMEI